MDQIVRTKREAPAEIAIETELGLDRKGRRRTRRGWLYAFLVLLAAGGAAGYAFYPTQSDARRRLPHRACNGRRADRRSHRHRHAAAAHPGGYFERIVRRRALRAGCREPDRQERRGAGAARHHPPRRRDRARRGLREGRRSQGRGCAHHLEGNGARLLARRSIVQARHGHDAGAGHRDRRAGPRAKRAWPSPRPMSPSPPPS